MTETLTFGSTRAQVLTTLVPSTHAQRSQGSQPHSAGARREMPLTRAPAAAMAFAAICHAIWRAAGRVVDARCGCARQRLREAAAASDGSQLQQRAQKVAVERGHRPCSLLRRRASAAPLICAPQRRRRRTRCAEQPSNAPNRTKTFATCRTQDVNRRVGCYKMWRRADLHGCSLLRHSAGRFITAILCVS